MMNIVSFACFLLLVASSTAVRSAQVGNWRHVRNLDDDATHTVLLLLRPRNTESLRALVDQIGDPSSEKYAQWLSKEELDEKYAATPEQARFAEAWARKQGALQVLECTFRVSDLNCLFKVEFGAWRHATSWRVIQRALRRYTVPREIADVVDLVHRINDFPPVRADRNVGDAAEQARQRRQRAVDASSSQLADDGTPLILAILARGDSIEVDFEPRCFVNNDPPTATPKAPCEDKGNAMTGVVLSGRFLDGSSAPLNSSFSYACKSVKPKSGGEQATLACSGKVHLSPSQLDIPIEKVAVSAVFSDGRQASTANPFMVMASHTVTPATVRTHYGIPDDALVSHPNVTQAVVEFEQQYYSRSDLEDFWRFNRLPSSRIVESGFNNMSKPGGEANLDIQWITGIAPGGTTHFNSQPAKTSAEIDDILTWLLQLASRPTIPLVHSVSYGMTEANVDTYLGKGYLARSDIELMKTASRGVTLVIADGDAGAGDLGGPPMGASSCSERLNPDWPSQSPYVLAVSATYVTRFNRPTCYKMPGICAPGDAIEGDVGVSLRTGMFWTTGGGVSNITVMPPWQKTAVDAYLSKQTAAGTLPSPGSYNSGGRWYPDVSVVGHNMATYIDGEATPVDGTSASAPVMAAMLTLVNQARMEAGKPQLGWVTPALYQLAPRFPDMFSDVLLGENSCSAYAGGPFPASNTECCSVGGWRADVGWDAVSGWGAPSFIRFRQVLFAELGGGRKPERKQQQQPSSVLVAVADF